ncbi:MAG: DUF4188 domain-containing protein [Rhodoferax sp.]
MIHKERMTARIEGDFVLFLIGMRFNQPWKVHKWLPVVSSMGRMLRELQSKPELGLLHQDVWMARTIMQVQYWRSMDHLLDYAKNRDSQHLPAWRAFNKAINNNGSVGIWHETYAVSEGSYENIYANMPPFGMGLAGTLEPVRGKRETAAGRLGK